MKVCEAVLELKGRGGQGQIKNKGGGRRGSHRRGAI